MKKTAMIAFVLLIGLSLFGCVKREQNTNQKQTIDNSQKETVSAKENSTADEATVRNLAQVFGKKLQMVSLLSPDVKNSMKDNYGALISPELLKKWQDDPQKAPGRRVSSPWPDRIEIQSVNKLTDGSYEVKGEIVEITSVEQQSGGAAAKQPITLKVKKSGDNWLIDDVTLGQYESTAANAKSGAIVYQNKKYGFDFSLPQSWSGYSVITDKWEGQAYDAASQSEKILETGPKISIRHPKWTKKEPRQDIPIMVFTLAQWNDLQNDKFHIGAAPIGPSELGRNSKYVFALPARYNFAFPKGYEEVETILSGKPLKPTENFSK